MLLFVEFLYFACCDSIHSTSEIWSHAIICASFFILPAVILTYLCWAFMLGTHQLIWRTVAISHKFTDLACFSPARQSSKALSSA
jgi:hypothetical protein